MQFHPLLSPRSFVLMPVLIAGLILSACADEKPAPPKPAVPDAAGNTVAEQVAAGAKDYAVACATCHQANGEGIPNVYPPLAGSEWVNGSEERAIAIVLYGLTGPITVKDVVYPGIPMPAFAEGSAFNWSHEQIAATLTYVRQAWGNKAAPVTAKKVGEIHAKLGARAEMTEEELKKLP